MSITKPTLQLNRDHPKFNWGMEILCCVSPNYKVPVKDLVDDFGIMPGHISTEIQTLNVEGVKGVKMRNTSTGGRVVEIIKAHWPEIRRLAQEYWDEVYAS